MATVTESKAPAAAAATAAPQERLGVPVEPCVAVIFGAAGDLTKRKLIPALCNLFGGGMLPENFACIGVLRDDATDQQFREKMGHDLKDATHPVDPKQWEWLQKRLYCLAGDLKQAPIYKQLSDLIAKVDKEHATGGRVMYYLSTPPSLISDIITHLGQAGLAQEHEGRWRRVIVEKPFGHDLESARALNLEIAKTLKEHQIYRIDHYLGKETVQNILVFRFANGIFEPIWNHNYIDHVQISVTESLGVEGRGLYYEEAGALRDMISNHLLQLLALIVMEPPASFDAEAVRDEKAKVMRAIKPLQPEEVLTKTVRGQYGEGVVNGKRLPAYRDEDKVSKRSTTDTYVAMRLKIDNWRWAGVPIYIRTGKRLAKRVTEITIQFKRAPHMLFRDMHVGWLSPNLLIISIQPKEGISLRFAAKVPGPDVRMADVDMEMKYADHFGQKPNTGYETLLYDCMRGDATLFMRADTVELGWSIVAPMLDVWKALAPRSFPNYASGSWGPKEADELLEKEGRSWRRVE